jgi:hypothetical protein
LDECFAILSQNPKKINHKNRKTQLKMFKVKNIEMKSKNQIKIQINMESYTFAGTSACWDRIVDAEGRS